jgi:parvulin-like peptidyl-prolyl isomerase
MKRSPILFLLCVFTVGSAFAQIDLQPVAIVRLTRSEPITVRQLKTELEKIAWQNLTMNLGRNPTSAEIAREVERYGVTERRQVLEVEINNRLALQAAERHRITVTDNELNQQITQLKAVMAQSIGRQPTDEEFAMAIKNETGMELPAFRDNTRRQLITQKYLLSKKQDVLSNIREPTEQEVIAFYNLNKSSFVRPDTVRFSMIQVPYGQDAASKSRAKTLADSINRDIGSNPSRFDEAVLRGQAPNAGYQAGDAGYLPRNTQAAQAAGEDFINTAFSLRQGEVSKVIEGVGAYQIIKITETLPFKPLDLDEIVEPGSRITVREYIRQGLLQQRQQEVLTRATQELVTELRAGNPFQIMENNLTNW